MFCSRSLAERIDRAEMRLVRDIAATIARRSPAAGALASPIAGGLAVFGAAGSPVNKVIGAGFGAALDRDALDEVERAWQARGEPVRVELSTLADPSLAPALTARGYRLTGFENVLGRPVAADTGVVAGQSWRITELDARDWRTWLDVALDGFAAPDGSAPGEEIYPRDALEAVFADVAATPGLRRYLLEVDGVPAGAASLRVDDGLAQLAGATTLPAYRRRGIQAALLRHRLAEAAAAGCDLAVVTVQPGSKSHANAVRQGFSLLYARAVLIKPLPR